MRTSVRPRSRPLSDLSRQALNVVFAVGQIAATIVGAITGSNANIEDRNPATTTPIVPADYAFSIWGVIYAGSLAYAIYQALPQHREDPLLRSIGWYTASAFLATTMWLIVAQNALLWMTVVCIVWILASLVGAFIQFIRIDAPRSAVERFVVVAPISIFTGWATVATIANASTTLQASGFSNVVLPNQVWAVVMLVIGGSIASFVTLRSRGNLGYALTVIWALVGIAAANGGSATHLAVTMTAGAMALLIIGVLVRGRTAIS